MVPYALLNMVHTHPSGSGGLPADDGLMEPDKKFTVRVMVPWWASPGRAPRLFCLCLQAFPLMLRGLLACMQPRSVARGTETHPQSPATTWHGAASNSPKSAPTRAQHQPTRSYKEPLSIVAATVDAALGADLPPGAERVLYLCDDGAVGFGGFTGGGLPWGWRGFSVKGFSPAGRGREARGWFLCTCATQSRGV